MRTQHCSCAAAVCEKQMRCLESLPTDAAPSIPPAVTSITFHPRTQQQHRVGLWMNVHTFLWNAKSHDTSPILRASCNWRLAVADSDCSVVGSASGSGSQSYQPAQSESARIVRIGQHSHTSALCIHNPHCLYALSCQAIQLVLSKAVG